MAFSQTWSNRLVRMTAACSRRSTMLAIWSLTVAAVREANSVGSSDAVLVFFMHYHAWPFIVRIQNIFSGAFSDHGGGLGFRVKI